MTMQNDDNGGSSATALADPIEIFSGATTEPPSTVTTVKHAAASIVAVTIAVSALVVGIAVPIVSVLQQIQPTLLLIGAEFSGR